MFMEKYAKILDRYSLFLISYLAVVKPTLGHCAGREPALLT